MKQEPKKTDRENLCPFCKKKATGRHHWDSGGSYYNCSDDDCMISMPLSKDINEAQELLHYTYDKLNEWTKMDSPTWNVQELEEALEKSKRYLESINKDELKKLELKLSLAEKGWRQEEEECNRLRRELAESKEEIKIKNEAKLNIEISLLKQLLMREWENEK